MKSCLADRGVVTVEYAQGMLVRVVGGTKNKQSGNRNAAGPSDAGQVLLNSRLQASSLQLSMKAIKKG
jgi:hypothetical protein